MFHSLLPVFLAQPGLITDSFCSPLFFAYLFVTLFQKKKAPEKNDFLLKLLTGGGFICPGRCLRVVMVLFVAELDQDFQLCS